MVKVKIGGHGAIEAAKTVLEVADVAWTAMEVTHHHHHDNQTHESGNKSGASIDHELENLSAENRRLRNTLEHNLKLLHNLSQSSFFNDCPPDLYARIVATVDSEHFMARLKNVQQASARGQLHYTVCVFHFKAVQHAYALLNIKQRRGRYCKSG